MTETDMARRKRLAMRSMRRGIKEMDLILGAYASDRIAGMNDATLSVYDELLSENDHDLYQWVTGQGGVPTRYSALISDISQHANTQ